MKTLTLTLACFCTIPLFSQIIFSEDFDGINGPTAGGAGTYSFPSGWLLRNVDNGTPNASVAYVNDAWERREDFNFNVGDSAMFSTSWYSPAGTADDWAWTPSMTLPSNAQLSWNAVAYDPSYPDGYEVRIMTASSTPGGPTGGTGVLGNQVTNSTVLFSTANENTSWTNRTADLSAYAGETVWIAFRNNSNDKFLLLIDDVVVQQILLYDANVTSTVQQEYSNAPIGVGPHFPMQATILNDGSNAITGVTLTADVYNSSNVLVHTESSSPGTLAPGTSGTVTLSDFFPAAADTFTVFYHSTITETDGDNTNDTLITQIVVSDSVYARDYGAVTANLGIGAGNGGYLGQQFTVNASDTLTSVTMYYTRGYTGKPCAAVVWDVSGGFPNQIIASTDTILYPDDSARVYTIPIQGLVILSPADYVITAVEFDSTLALGQTNNIFTTGKTWVNWPTNPLGQWAHNEDFGASFSKPYMLRGNFGTVCQNSYATFDTTICFGETYTVGSHTYSVSGVYQDTFPSGYCSNFVTTNLTVLPQDNVTTDTTICFGETYTVGTHTYSASGVYQDTLPSGACYTYITTNLTVLPQDNATTDTTICFGETYTVGAHIYSASGVYLDTLPSGNCYTYLTTNLTVLSQVPTMTSVSSDKTTFSVNPVAGASYQWIDCNTNLPIAGATSDTYVTSSVENVAVAITSNGCSDTSSCITNEGLGLKENSNAGAIRIMPNPAQNSVVIDGGDFNKLLVLTTDGRQVMEISLVPGTKQSVDVSGLARGVYYLVTPTGGSGIRFVLQ